MQFKSTTRVLLVEDNEGDVILISNAIEELDQNVEIKVLREGKSTLDYLETLKPDGRNFIPDLILLDINLPFVNGLEILEYIKKQALLKKTPVVLLTASSSRENITEAYGNHANCYITKPGLSHEYKRIIKDILFFWKKNRDSERYE